MAEEEEERRRHPVLAKTFSLEDEKDSEHTASNVIRKILSLFKNVRPGSDLTNFQVVHHPPVSALHATHEKEKIDVIWCQYFTPKFRGAYVDVEIKGKRVMKLLNHKETYEMNQPRLIMRFLPTPRAHWTGKVKIKCPETDLEAEINLMSDSFIERFRGNNNRSIKGKIFESSTGNELYNIFGHWDRAVMAKNVKTGEVEVIYNAEENITGLKPPIVKNLKEVMESESAIIWSEVSEGILKKDWERAREAKCLVEAKQRESLKNREASGELWVPKHFSVVKDGKDWDLSPLQSTVPRAPLVITEAEGEKS